MDQELKAVIEQALAGDQDAFEHLIHQYSGLLYAQVIGMLHNSAETEDVVQDAFIKAYTYRKLLVDPEKFPAWLMAISRNLARDWLRRKRPILLEDDVVGELPDPHGHRPGWRLERDDMRRGILAALHLLPERQRLAVTMRYFENMDYASIELAMGVSNGALRGMLDRARNGLRRMLRPMIEDGDPLPGQESDDA